MKQPVILGVDLGATNIRAAQVSRESISPIQSKKINSSGSEQEVLQDVFEVLDLTINKEVKGIGMGVPGIVDVSSGTVLEVQYIPSWKEVPLKKHLEERYQLPVYVNNDANCFALGEHYFGKGRGMESMIGLAIGTGMGAGIIIHNRLYAGPNCGAGEFGMVEYLDKVYEYYCSGQFFQNVYGLDGQDVFRHAQQGDANAMKLYSEMGEHLGNAIKMIMFTYDPELIIIGGSLRFAYSFYEKAMWQRIRTFAYPKSTDRLKIELSDLENSAILGAAALYFDTL